MKIAIVGAVGAGKTHLVNELLFPALFNSDYGFEIWENGVLTAHRNGVPKLRVSTFTDPQQAAKWLGEP